RPIGRVRARRPRRQVEEAVAQAIAFIRAGDIYQANISQGFDATLDPMDHPYSAFRRLIGDSPAPFSAYFHLGADRIAATHSPERFLRVDRGGRVESRPIKGTRPRGGDPSTDARFAAALLASDKDRAENLMIVDLMRNDLARVCAPGSVRAPRLYALESYANVHHLVSTVIGRLPAGGDAFDLVRAAFPAGSITGAPKVRAMQIIAELEGESRGPYCGAVGYVGADGAADLNVMIRAIAFTRGPKGWRARFRAGAGIVADSDPITEYDEMLAKAASIRRALGGRGGEP
ncbi:MAG: anthranilate synthase component I family protein, partial [Caulobacterales bacterium]|nr:anthranilate synthase component I family protein [Caulobacterales bacterium]